MMPSSKYSTCSPVVLGVARSQTPTPLLTTAVRGAGVFVGVGGKVGVIVGTGDVAVGSGGLVISAGGGRVAVASSG